ncbi:MAG: TRAP transporter small permease [Deltaproteobacteria bacterium]|nr:TRAP transporter small permease [Deltaproteobacteria bacterium]
MSRFAKASERLGGLVELVAGLLLLGMLLVVSLQVGLRYLFQASLPWPEELSVLFFGWAAWLGSAAALYRNVHLRMDMLREKLGKANRRRLDVLVHVVVLAFLLLLIAKSLPVVKAGDLTFYAFLPFTVMYLYAALPVGAGLMGLLIFFRILAPPAHEESTSLESR